VLSRSMSPIRTWAMLLASLLAVCGSLAIRPALAGAAPAPNQTQLTLDPLLVAGLKVSGVKIRPLGPATLGSGGFYFPVGRQNMSSAFVGTARHSGGFELLLGDLRIGFRNFIITTKAGAPATGTLSGEPVINGHAVALQFPLSKVTVSSALLNQNLLVGKTKLEIDRSIVDIINDTLKVQVIKPGQPWATTETRLPWAATALPAR
jgi:hypothetical protein